MTDAEQIPALRPTAPPDAVDASSQRFLRLDAEHRRQTASDALTVTKAPANPTVGFTAEDTEAFAELVRDRYTIERELGRGGMGIVLLGHDRRLDRRVAIKLLPRTRGQDPLHRQRFLREARTVAKLSHPHIVPVLHAEEAGPFAYFTMAFVEGESLGARVRSAGNLSVAVAVKILRELAWALAYSHAFGIVHRDIKPENILLDSVSGRALLTDFGIAQRIGDSTLTGPDRLVGTVLFMSPEQAQNHELDGRSDLYSLGLVGFWLFAGQVPHECEAPIPLLLRRATEPAPLLRAFAPEVPPRLAAVIDRCLARAPGARFQTGEELAAALARVLDDGITASPEMRPIGEAEIAAVLAQAWQLRQHLRDNHTTLAAICAALDDGLGRRGDIPAAFFQRFALIRPANTDDIRVLAAAYGYLLPDSRHSTAADLRALFAGREDVQLFERLLDLSRGLPRDHALVHRVHLHAARVRAHREGGARESDGAVANARLLHDVCDLAARLLAHQSEGSGDTAVNLDSATSSLYEEILGNVRENDGVRAAKRLLDLARLRGVPRSQLVTLGALVDRTYRLGSAQGPEPTDEEWFGLLAQLLACAGSLVSAASEPRAAHTQAVGLRRGGLFAAKKLFLARRGAASSPPSGASFRCRDIGKSYRRGRASHQVLGGVSLELYPGTITGVVGPNGCGKTTLLRIIAGQLAPDFGVVDYPRLDPSQGARSSPDWQSIIPQIGYVAQRPPRWFGGLGDNLHRWAALHGVVGEDNEVEVEFYLNRLDLVRYRDARWTELSGGYRMRFELARVMVARPRLLVLDEPLAPLDIDSQETFLNDLRDLAGMDGQQLPIILSSQHIPEVESIADTLLCLDQAGRPRFCGPARAVAGPNDERVFELGGAIREDLIEFVCREFSLQAHRTGERWLLRVAPDVPEDRLLRVILSRAGSIEYFRDITRSCLRFLRGRKP